MSNSVERDSYFDNVKGILVILVVVGHFIDSMTGINDAARASFLWIYSFHMPLFIFISGYFSGGLVKSKARVVQRFCLFMSLYVFYEIAICLTNLITAGEGSFSLLSESGAPWYMFVMAVYSVILYFIRDVGSQNDPAKISSAFKNPILIFSVVLALFVGYDSSIEDYLMLSRVIVFFPFFYLGYLLRNVNIKEKIKKACPWLVAAAILIVTFIAALVFIDKVYGMRYMFTGRNPYSNFGSAENWGFLLRLLAYVISAAMSIFVLAVTPGKSTFKPLTQAGKSSLQIYLYHRPILYVMTNLGLDELLFRQGAWGAWLWVLISLVLAFALAVPALGKPVTAWQRTVNKYL